MNIQLIRETLTGSLAGTNSFPDVVGALIGAGVESYRADLMRKEEVFYMPDGQTHIEAMHISDSLIEDGFIAADVVAAIRDSQSGRCKYPDFLRRIMDAGTTGYVVFLSGRKVVYFGRRGEMHIEDFPSALVSGRANAPGNDIDNARK